MKVNMGVLHESDAETVHAEPRSLSGLEPDTDNADVGTFFRTNDRAVGKTALF